MRLRSVAAAVLAAFSMSAQSTDALVGSTFVCEGRYGMIYTFLPGGHYKEENRGFAMSTTPLSYTFDGKTLVLRYIDVNGKERTNSMSATYLREKGKLLLKDPGASDDQTKICNER